MGVIFWKKHEFLPFFYFSGILIFDKIFECYRENIFDKIFERGVVEAQTTVRFIEQMFPKYSGGS